MKRKVFILTNTIKLQKLAKKLKKMKLKKLKVNTWELLK